MNDETPPAIMCANNRYPLPSIQEQWSLPSIRALRSSPPNPLTAVDDEWLL